MVNALLFEAGFGNSTSAPGIPGKLGRDLGFNLLIGGRGADDIKADKNGDSGDLGSILIAG